MHITVIQSAINFNLLKFVFLCTFVVVVIAGCSGRPSLLTHRAHSDGFFFVFIFGGNYDWWPRLEIKWPTWLYTEDSAVWIFLLLV